jgi:hypothetical protein
LFASDPILIYIIGKLTLHKAAKKMAEKHGLEVMEGRYATRGAITFIIYNILTLLCELISNISFCGAAPGQVLVWGNWLINCGKC